MARLAFLVCMILPYALFGQQDMIHLKSAHFDAYAEKGFPAALNLESIVEEREKAFTAISGLFAVDPDIYVTLTFYHSEEAKKLATGHSGLGWATEQAIVEVYNDSIRLDPYHELVHIIGGTLGHPPACIDEGFAVYVSERLGADALTYLGYKGVSISEAACRLVSSGKNLPFGRLFDFTELGSKESQGPISYPQSASIVKYLIDSYGIARFRSAYGELRSPTDRSVRDENRRVFRKIYGSSFESFEDEWKHSVCVKE